MYKFTNLSQDLIIIETEEFADDRGSFTELYRSSLFTKNGVATKYLQESLSYSKKGTLRGLHYQKDPMAQGKLVTVVSGWVFDVVVDIRKGSPDFGKWYGVELSSSNKKMLYIPEGFAHGFAALEDSQVLYKLTKEYSKEHECGIIWDDPDIAIRWPLKKPIMSEKDAKFGSLKSSTLFTYKAQK